jgi:hypothetical protein
MGYNNGSFKIGSGSLCVQEPLKWVIRYDSKPTRYENTTLRTDQRISFLHVRCDSANAGSSSYVKWPNFARIVAIPHRVNLISSALFNLTPAKLTHCHTLFTPLSDGRASGLDQRPLFSPSQLLLGKELYLRTIYVLTITDASTGSEMGLLDLIQAKD